MGQTIKDIFLPLDKLEIKQKETGIFAKEFEEENLTNDSQSLVIHDKLFYDSQNILIRKHRRFAPYPLHSHQFLEFNYMLAGESQQVVNGKELRLKEKQLLLLDTNSEHELAALGPNDLLINFLFRTKELNIDLLKRIDTRSAGLTYNFLMSAILGNNYNDNFLVLDLTEHPEIQTTFEQMMHEFHEPKRLTKEIMDAYTQILFLQLSRVYHSQLEKIYHGVQDADFMIKVLQRIENDYRKLTLLDLAAEFGYNKNYLSNMIKEKTGKTFKELVTLQRLNEAHRLVLTTDAAIETIAEFVGYSNKTQFYKKYRDYFGATPKEIRHLR
ncbi:AraC family transcriptional regulator [Enterococcus sp. CSURQ0835]|uniref:AraC family transcriptional regulator n=1 Tax=Enterococcus sp. CSURQ0835 TaxID=2681394 RepID=UPI00135A26A4|nr:AraC family transcriptional regulator [Enterococcus sp. CSURQ0835]